MENLIEKLRTEAGLSEEQAVKSIAVFKAFMDEEKMDIDWDKFFRGKYDEFKEASKRAVGHVSSKAEDISDKVFDKVEDLAIGARRAVRDASKKVYDKLNDEEK